MALRARLVAPPPTLNTEWPWHKAKVASLPVHHMWGGDRRMEAENYLASGHGIRLSIRERSTGWVPLSTYAKVWQPSRLKGILVRPDSGTPFLAATQVFDLRPVPRKWLALEKTNKAENRFVDPGTILVTCSGAVGRATLAGDAIASILISHDLLRIESKDASNRGWIYAFLRSPQGRAMMNSAQYGHIIKHLETSHLDALPIPQVSDQMASWFAAKAEEILEFRNNAYSLRRKADHQFETSVGLVVPQTATGIGFSVAAATSLFSGSRRFEAAFHNPDSVRLVSHLKKKGAQPLSDLGFKIWVPKRYKRNPAADGVEYFDSSDLLEINPESTKRFADSGFGDHYGGRVQQDWVLMPSSGQVYGIIGNAVLAGPGFDGKVVSNHVLRLAPTDGAKCPSGYLQVALSHPHLGRPMVKALAFGSSVPEIDPEALLTLPVIRLGDSLESEISRLIETAASDSAKADQLEHEIGEVAGTLIDRFIAGESLASIKTH